eukprot:scaffold11361_cov32-Tisochrysis_lutea.AAC.4
MTRKRPAELRHWCEFAFNSDLLSWPQVLSPSGEAIPLASSANHLVCGLTRAVWPKGHRRRFEVMLLPLAFPSRNVPRLAPASAEELGVVNAREVASSHRRAGSYLSVAGKDGHPGPKWSMSFSNIRGHPGRIASAWHTQPSDHSP